MRVDVTFNSSAVGGTRAKLVAILEARRRAAFAALNQAGERIMADSKELVPVDLGTLKASGHVTADESAGVVTLGYGGPAADYAIVQHESLDFHHTTGQAKFLEEPFIAAESTIQADLVDAVRKVSS